MNKDAALRSLRIGDLELFITAARLGNLGQAAVLHHLSQSAASTAIMRVEKSLGRNLCTHEKRQFGLTKEGKELLPRAEEWIKQLKQSVVLEELPFIRVATTHAIARVAIPPILPVAHIELKLMRPDKAYAAVLRDQADVAIVLDNATWEGVIISELGHGCFQLYSSVKDAHEKPVLLPEDQIEVLAFQQRWFQVYGHPLAIKARLPSWSLIADICSSSTEVGFLPDFLAQQVQLHPVEHQPTSLHYRILALHRHQGDVFQKRLNELFSIWRTI